MGRLKLTDVTKMSRTEILENDDNFEKFFQEFEKYLWEEFVLRLPQLTLAIMENQQKRLQIITNLFKENPEFEQYKEIVTAHFGMWMSANPGKDMTDHIDVIVKEIKKHIEVGKESARIRNKT